MVSWLVLGLITKMRNHCAGEGECLLNSLLCLCQTLYWKETLDHLNSVVCQSCNGRGGFLLDLHDSKGGVQGVLLHGNGPGVVHWILVSANASAVASRKVPIPFIAA